MKVVIAVVLWSMLALLPACAQAPAIRVEVRDAFGRPWRAMANTAWLGTRSAIATAPDKDVPWDYTPLQDGVATLQVPAGAPVQLALFDQNASLTNWQVLWRRQVCIFPDTYVGGQLPSSLVLQAPVRRPMLRREKAALAAVIAVSLLLGCAALGRRSGAWAVYGAFVGLAAVLVSLFPYPLAGSPYALDLVMLGASVAILGLTRKLIPG
ncbi:MAG TPA: hypothetical protein VGO93_19345 [Candidatus Xenobia bacterium]|jgi:hypothetical protein